jgi:hypothetical protein
MRANCFACHEDASVPNPVTAFLLSRLRGLRFPTLALVTGVLFLLTLLVPDPIPFVDELLLGLLTLLFANWKQRRVVDSRDA